MIDSTLEAFRDACGAAYPIRLKITEIGRGRATTFDLGGPFAILGRDPRSNIVLKGRDVSKRHALIQIIGGRLCLIDLGSRTGISWQGALEDGWLDVGAFAQIGSYRLELEGGCPTPRRPAAGRNPMALGSITGRKDEIAVLEFSQNGVVQTEWQVNRIVTLVGHAPQCKIRVPNELFSRFNSALVYTPQGVWLVDLFGKQGVQVNGRPVRFALVDGDSRIELGNVTVRRIFKKHPFRSFPPAELIKSALALPEIYPHANAPSLSYGAAGNLTRVTLSQALSAQETRHAAEMAQIVNQFWQMQQDTFAQFHRTVLQMLHAWKVTLQEETTANAAKISNLERDTELLKAALEARQIAANVSTVGDVTSSSLGADVAEVAPRSQAPSGGASPSLEEKDRVKIDAANLHGTGPQIDKENIHAWLSQRMAAFETEHEGWWQKTLNFFNGKS